MLAVLHPNSLAVYKDTAQTVPRFNLWQGEGSVVKLCGLPGSFYILVESKSSVDAREPRAALVPGWGRLGCGGAPATKDARETCARRHRFVHHELLGAPAP